MIKLMLTIIIVKNANNIDMLSIKVWRKKWCCRFTVRHFSIQNCFTVHSQTYCTRGRYLACDSVKQRICRQYTPPLLRYIQVYCMHVWNTTLLWVVPLQIRRTWHQVYRKQFLTHSLNTAKTCRKAFGFYQKGLTPEQCGVGTYYWSCPPQAWET